MSKAAKQSIFILLFLLVGSVVLVAIFALKADSLQKDNKSLKAKAETAISQEKKKAVEIDKLKGEMKVIAEEKTILQEKTDRALASAAEISAKMDSILSERDSLAGRVDTIKQERDDLVSKVQELTKRGLMDVQSFTATDSNQKIDESLLGDDEYWAKVLRDKASLQIKMDSFKDKISQSEIAIVEFRQMNADLQIELETLKHGRGEIEREIQHKEALINNLSLELARTKNDKKFTSDRVAKLNKENAGLRRQIKELFTTKSGLEKTVVKLQQDKRAFERRINDTDSLIQSKIDEIWEIKESLDRTFKSTSLAPSSSNGVDLPPIVINSQVSADTPAPINDKQESDLIPGFNGRVVSVNEDNNFLIVDIGEKSGLRLGDMLSVYRDSKYIARLEVIQVRKDISAADIKDQWSKVVVGDIVK